VDRTRYLVVTADDFGIGPATTQGILELARLGRLTATVLLVTSPYAEAAVQSWRHAGRPLALGWHPCLTLDRPVLAPGLVGSLVDAKGRFWSLRRFLTRLYTGRIRAAEIEAELRAQAERFTELVGAPPDVVNSHHHVQVFPPVGAALAGALEAGRTRPYVRRVREPLRTLACVPGARRKRCVLSALGRRASRLQERRGFPGNDWLGGVTDPAWLADPRFFERWLARLPGRVVELTCHPGHLDLALVGRDCREGDGQLQRRVREWGLLRQPGFVDAYQRAGFTLVSPARLSSRIEGFADAA
jgi:predicted glycoside hydrolase/deacetylase ChbG (UPF0249 family)